MGIRKNRKAIAVCAVCSMLAGCTGLQTAIQYKNFSEPAPIIPGPPIEDNITPVSAALSCLADQIRIQKARPVAITVGNVRDYTGKFTEEDGGKAITQGGALMVISALGKLGNAIAVRERFDTQVADLEQQYLDKRRLGDGSKHVIKNGDGEQSINWLPDTGGSVLKSEVYIVGGITELNYNISSGGLGIEVANIGPRARVFSVNVAVDLRLVNSKNLNMLKSVSLQKQVTGYEVSFGVFKFFGDYLYNIETGIKAQEPLQLAIRTIIELATLELVSFIYSIDHEDCLAMSGYGEDDELEMAVVPPYAGEYQPKTHPRHPDNNPDSK